MFLSVTKLQLIGLPSDINLTGLAPLLQIEIASLCADLSDEYTPKKLSNLSNKQYMYIFVINHHQCHHQDTMQVVVMQ